MANAQLDVTFATNRLGNQNLIHNGFKFQVKTRRGERCYWQCSIRNCPATINTRNNIPTKIGVNHNHQPDRTQLKVNDVLQSMKARARKELTPIPTIYDEELVKLRNREWNVEKQQLVEKIPTFYSCKDQLYNERHKTLPALPMSVEEILINGEWAETTTGQPFLLADDNTNGRMLVFSTRENLTHLTAADTIYCDGTFYACPALFFQLYTFHAMVDGTMFPLVYSLLPGKDQHVYTRLLTVLKEICQRFNILLQPTTMFLDYEVAARNAVAEIFPDINIKGCFFHYTQCIWRNAQKHGLQAAYKENNNIQLLVRRAAVLPLLPPNSVEDVWFNALEEIDAADTNIPTLPFTDYVTSYWVETNRNLWNHYATEGPRTTNHLEGWHGKLKKLVKSPHPNIFSMIKLLKQEEAVHACTLLQYRAGGKRVLKKRKYRELENRLATLKTRLLNNEMTPVQYADAASHLLHID